MARVLAACRSVARTLGSAPLPLATLSRAPRGGSSSARIAPWAQMPRRSLFIQVQDTPNPDSMKFLPEGKVVLPEQFGNGVHFNDLGQAKGSKLVRRLLKIDAVTSVFLGRDFISVNKKEGTNWAALRPVVLDTLMDAFSEAESRGVAVIEEIVASPDTLITEEDDEVTAMIKELLDTRIRPAVQEDGGDIFFKGFDRDSGIVKLKMGGSCVGCPSSTATLRNGVENMLMYYIPEVKGILEIKDELEQLNDKELKSLEERLAAAGAQA